MTHTQTRWRCRLSAAVAMLAMILGGSGCTGKAGQQPSSDAPADSAALAAEWASGSTRIDSADVAERGEEIRAQKRLICFDLDGTLTQHKTPLSAENRAVLDELGKRYHLVMCGGGGCERIYNQMNQYPIDILGNYSMQESRVENGEFRLIRQETVHPDTARVLAICSALREKYGYTDYAGESVEFHPSGMMTFALLGTKADPEAKLAFDPDKRKRQAMFAEVCDSFPQYAVFIGGTTSFDLAELKFNKYSAVMRYAEEHGCTKEQVLFVGDDFGDGGNDSHIRLFGMDYIQITDYTRLPEKLHFLYAEP
ncbi:MAG: HAD-IIB family hydrolase [Bacteroidaceae bacterium]|nr:HAD-IIB family hydrolase [Bacteroidaceae bacterium]